jgi:predicted transcriptional regulator
VVRTAGLAAGRSRRLDVRVDDDTLNALQKLARSPDRAVSDLVREALNRYLAAS